jgi:serine/threonine-protein kinase
VVDRSPGSAGEAYRREVVRLARVQASLSHPHLVPVLKVCDKRGLTYFVTQLVRGETLADRLRRGPLEPATALTILGQVAAALELAAVRGLVHRDLRPAAVALLPGQRINAVVTDFGITCPPARGCELLDHGEAMAYRSPEELRGNAPRVRSLVYSLACILFECLAGEPPYRHGRPLLMMHAHLVGTPERISERDGSLPGELDALFAQAMSADPRKRPSSPAQLVEAAGRTLGVAVRVPLATDRKRQRAQEKVATRARRRARRRANPRERALTMPRRAKVSLWAAIALTASAASGFATGNASWSPDPATQAPSTAAVVHARYLRTVDTAIDRLVARRAAARSRLRAADGRRGQAVAAKALAVAFRDAHDTLPVAPVITGSVLKRSLLDASRAYERLAAAARTTDARAWRSAKAKAVRSEVEVESALRALRSAEPG